SETPAPGATNVPTSTTVTATFDRSVVSTTISFVLKDSSNNTVASTLSYNDTNHTATLHRNTLVEKKRTYTASVRGAQEAKGNTRAAELTWSFTTIRAPTGTGETPASGATNVATNTTVTATFDRSVVSTTISFVLKDNSNNTVAATVSYNDTNHTAT